MVHMFFRARCWVFALGMLAAASTPVMSQAIIDNLAIHGYLTQGYAIADSHQIVGIPKGGTFDYRRAAILIRFKGSPNDAFVVQLANRDLGDSPTNALTSEVQLDWAFYERRLGSKTTMRIGKEPIPMGIFNETRYVGTLLPFYRAPFGFYEEGSFTSETLNGIVVTRQITPASQWKLSGSVFGGEFEYLQSGTVQTSQEAPPTFIVTPANAKNVIGTQLWLQTPLTGLRVGLGGERRDDHGQFFGNTSTTHGTKDWWASADGNFGRLTTRAEFRQFIFSQGGIRVRSYYGQVGYRILDALTVNLQRDVTDLDYQVQSGHLHIPYDRDNALGINYAFAPNIVVKFEVHNANGFTVEEPVDVLGGAPLHDNYLITSLSVAF